MPLPKIKMVDKKGDIIEVEPIRSVRSSKDYNNIVAEYEENRLKLERFENNEKIKQEAIDDQQQITTKLQAAVLRGVRKDRYTKPKNKSRNRKNMIKASRKRNRKKK